MSGAGQRLREADRQLFTLVAEAAFENPFGARRPELDAAISDAPLHDPSWVPRMLQKVGTRLHALGAQHKHEATSRGASALSGVDVRTFAAADRELVEYTVLFEVFHRYVAELDRLIESQLRAGGTHVRVDIADDFLSSLVAYGFEPERAHRMLELFYQMRRAYRFIARLVGHSPSMGKLRQELWQAVFTRDIRRYEKYLWNRMEDFSTILLGETGSGKGAAAAAIGMSGFIPFDAKRGAFSWSPRESFVPIHLNEYPETLFESEIFGHKKGAFTGAVDNHDGALSRCPAYGTVFFDEIGEATLPVQVKLLRVLQERVYTPVGSREPRRFYGRILAATHRSLAELRMAGALREDFFYRLCSTVIEVPPLRTRISETPEELPALVEHVCADVAGPGHEALADEVTAVIARDLGPRHDFPGNVRELEQCVRRVLLTGGCAPDAKLTRGSGSTLASLFEAGTLTAEELLARYCELLYSHRKNYVEVARITGLDRRTVKKYVARQHAAE